MQAKIRQIQEKLGGNPQNQDIEELEKLAQNKKWSEKEAQFFNKELEKLERLNPQAPDYSIQFNYYFVNCYFSPFQSITIAIPFS